MAILAADRRFWDPILGIFDLSLTFEEFVLQIVPSGLTIALLPLFAHRYRHGPVYVRSSPLLWAKLAAAAILIACQAASVDFHRHLADPQTNTTVPAASMELAAAIHIGFMIYVGHKHAIRSSALLALYLLLTLLIDVVKSRSFFLRPGLDALGGLAAATASVRLCLLILEGRSKRDLLLDDEIREISRPESTSGYFNRAFFLFLNPLYIIGFSHKLGHQELAQLGHQDLAQLGLDFSSKVLHKRLLVHWKPEENMPSRYRLMLACFHTWKWELFQIMIPRLINIGLSFAQPFLIERVIRTVELDQKQQGDHLSSVKRLGIQAATFFTFIGVAVSKTAATHLSNRLATQVRGGLVSQLMQKTHLLSQREAKRSTVLTHISSDIEAIIKGLSNCIDIPMTILEAGLGIFILSRFIGSSCFFVLLPVLGTNFCSFLLGRVTGPAMARWNKSIEVRVAKTTEVLKQLPGIQMLGLGPVVRRQIHRLRVEEMEMSKPYRFFMALFNMTQQVVDLGTPVIVIAAAFFLQGFDGKMSSTQVFPTLAVVNLIQGPTMKALGAYADVTGMIACFDRLQKFLGLAERKDSRVKWDPSAHPQVFEPVPTHFGSTVLRPRPPAQSAGGIIQFANASVGPVGMDGPLLSEINLALPRGSISGVLGGTGYGKSTFLQSILGETTTTSGYIYTDNVDNIAYCGSETWLRDASIRENIIGCLPYDPVRYEIAIQSCQLDGDLARFPGGDEYVIGPHGFNLSGGQRQRVALARAVFARYDITLIDDAFSSLDRRTAASVMFALCGENGVLRSSGSTVVVSTYLPEVLSVIDQLITVDAQGQVSVDRVNFRNPVRGQMIAYFLSSAAPSVREESEDREKAAIRRSWSLDLSRPFEAEESYSKQQGNLRLYLIFINSIGKLRCLALAFLALILAFNELIPEIYIRIWTDKAPSNGIWFIGYSCMAAFGCGLMALAYWLLYSVVAVRAAIRLHERMLDTTMRVTLGSITSTKTGNLINQFSQDSDLYSKTMPYYFFRTLYMGFSVLALIGIILSSATYMSASGPVLTLSIFFIQKFYLRTSRQMRHLDLKEQAPLYTFFSETADGVLYIQAFGWQERNLEKGYRLLDNSQRPFYLMLCIQQWLGLVLGLLSSGVAVTLASIAIWTNKSTSGSAVGLSFLSILNFQRSALYFIEAWTGSETSVAGLARLDEFEKKTPQEERPSPPAELPQGWPLAGNVEFTNVSARYRPADEVPPIIRDLSLDIEEGEKIGLIGQTGSGKSSLLLTLLGFLQYDGIVEIDGVDIKTVDPDLLRSRVITIPQDSVQFNDTIRRNLLPFTINDDGVEDEEKMRERAARDAMLVDVLQQLNIWSQLSGKGGLDAMLLDVGYSKGEIQLLSIARAVVRRRETGIRLILVDEATSNLDPVRDDATQQVMQVAFNGCTVITVAHRQEAIRNVDCTIRMDGGVMVDIVVASHVGAAPAPVLGPAFGSESD